MLRQTVVANKQMDKALAAVCLDWAVDKTERIPIRMQAVADCLAYYKSLIENWVHTTRAFRLSLHKLKEKNELKNKFRRNNNSQNDCLCSNVPPMDRMLAH